MTRSLPPRLARLARPLAEVVWPGLEPHRGWPGRASHRLTRLLWRWLPWLGGLYGLIVAISAAGGVINDGHRLVGGVAFLYLLPAAAGVALATRRALDGWRLVTLFLLVFPFLVPPPGPPVPPLEPWEWCLWMPVLLLVGVARPGRETVAVGVVSGVLLGALTLLTPWPVDPGLLVVSLFLMALPLVVGASVGARMSSQRALAQEQARVARAQAEQGALAERARIAREMHDVVAHHMSMIAVRCETAPYRLAGLNETGQAEIAEIGSAARAAMSDMQRLLGVLRPGEGGRAELAPQPSLGEVRELVDQARATGLRLDADVDGDLGELPEAVGLSAYRIVQEALTNARRHAPGAAVTLRLRRAQGGLELVVRSAAGGREPAGPVLGGGGHGLAGMRERAALHGGELSAGPDAGGGFTVRAVLPVPEEPKEKP
ncbi:sensor histidine kinase [Pseudonocardia acaciae]|uniref:sensor histidine kinase n=1 Tax=Pseudonocardia acaciae TaxID=551276 RepID=UPI000A5B17D9|nr:histidine kinase [Pseudonocardia acaciae]